MNQHNSPIDFSLARVPADDFVCNHSTAKESIVGNLISAYPLELRSTLTNE